MTLHWLSFCDPGRPEGSAFLGVAVVEAPDFLSAVRFAHAIGCNPGGEVLCFEIPDGLPVPVAFRDRLLDKEEAEHLEGVMAVKH